jgi:hypothetical protein
MLPRTAQAHRLDGEYRVLPGNKVQIEAWFENDDVPHGAKVRIYRGDGSLLFPNPGELNDKGIYVFSYDKAEPLKVVVSAGQGHRKELVIPAGMLSAQGPAPGAAPEEFPVKDLLLGITFLLALAAFVLSVLNTWRLRDPRRG